MRTREEQREAFGAALRDVAARRGQLVSAFQAAVTFRSRYPGLPEAFANERRRLSVGLREALNGYEPGPEPPHFDATVAVGGPIDPELLSQGVQQLSDAVLDAFFRALEDAQADASDPASLSAYVEHVLLGYVGSHRQNLIADLG